jgi:hypothetical protein
LTAVSISASHAATNDAALLKQAQGIFKPLPQNMGTDEFPITPERGGSGRPCRYIRNGMIDDLAASGLQPLPVPAQQSLTSPLAASGDREWTARMDSPDIRAVGGAGAAREGRRISRAARW